MIKLRIAILSFAIFIACLAGAFWTLFAAEKLAPQEGGFRGAASPWRPEPEPVKSGPGPSAAPATSDIKSVESLVAQIRDTYDGPKADWSVTCRLRDAAVKFGAAAVGPLARVASDENEKRGLRLLAIDMLGRIEEPVAVPSLIGCLDVRHPEDIRSAAVGALGANAAARERASWLFFDLLRSDAQPSVRARAADLVGRSGETRAVPLLVSVLGKDASPTVRMAAAGGLGLILDREALPALRDSARMDKDAGVRTACVESLGNYLDPMLRAFFESMEKSDGSEQVRCAARRQLWRIPAED